PERGGHCGLRIADCGFRIATTGPCELRPRALIPQIAIHKPPIPMPLPVATKAPAFTLKSKKPDGLVDVTIPPPAQTTVLLFFPLAFSSVCTDEMCSVSQGLAAYTGSGAEVIAVSVDSPFAQEAWAKANNIGITLASDLNKEAAKAYDVVFK